MPYPAKLLLANDDRIHFFLDASVLRDWNEAVQEWRSQKKAGAASPKLFRSLPVMHQPTSFSDEEFFSLTQQLEDITAVLAGHSTAPSIESNSINVKSSCKATTPLTTKTVKVGKNIGTGEFPPLNASLDVFSLDLEMYATSLNAEQWRHCQVATEAYEKGDYGLASETFSAVIDSCLPNVLNAALLGNRAACYLRMENFKLSLRDATRSYEIDNHYVPGIRRAVRSLLCCGKCSEARMIIEKYKKVCRCSFDTELANISLYELYSAFLDRNEHAIALRHLDELLKSISCATFEALKVQLLSIEEGNQVALAFACECLQRYPDFPELLYWRAQLRFLESSCEKELAAVQPLFCVSVPSEYAAQFRQANHRIQQCIELCLELDSLYTSKEWNRLIELSSAAIQRPFIGDRLRSMVLAKRAHSYYEISRFYDCIDDINASIRGMVAENERAQLLLLKAFSEEKLARWSDAVRTAELAAQEYSTTETAKVLHRLRERLKDFQRRRQEEQKSCSSRGGKVPEARGTSKGADTGRRREWEKQSKNCRKHTVCDDVAALFSHFSLPDGASVERVKKSYRTLAMRWHPDRWCGAPVEHQKEAEEKFKLLKAHYDELLRIIET